MSIELDFLGAEAGDSGFGRSYLLTRKTLILLNPNYILKVFKCKQNCMADLLIKEQLYSTVL